MNILIIDDNKAARQIERDVLAQLGHEHVEEAADGQDGLSKAAATQPDLILCGWTMPRMGGLDFVRAFRQHNTTTPIIMVTIEKDKAKVVEAIKAGVSNYIVKPFTPDLLSQRINETLARKAA